MALCDHDGSIGLAARVSGYRADMEDGRLAEQLECIAARLQQRGWSLATAESMTTGQITVRLGRGAQASEWLRGGVVAYSSAVKFDVLGVDRGPGVTERCARQMAEGVARLLDVEVRGGGDRRRWARAGGSQPAGPVSLAVTVNGRTDCERLALDGDPDQVIHATANRALIRLAARLDENGDEKETP